MGDKEPSTLFIGLLLIAAAAGIAYKVGVLSFKSLLIAGGVGLLGFLIWGLWKQKMFEKMTEAVDKTTGLLSSGKSIDELWDDLQEWAAKEPREMELVWKPDQTDFQMIPVESLDDEVYNFTSIITAVKGASNPQHICVENTTGYVITFRTQRFEEERKFPFRYIEFVEELRRQNLTSDEILTRMQQNSLGELSGGYQQHGTPIDRSKQQGGSGNNSQTESGDDESD